MKRIPEDFFEKIEFTKVIQVLLTHCKGEDGKDFFRKLDFLSSPDEVRSEILFCKEFHRSFQLEDRIPVSNYLNIENDLFLLSKNNYVLDAESLFRINLSIRQGHELIVFFQNSSEFPLMKEIALEVDFQQNLVSIIDKILDEEGNVRPNASPELLKISKRIKGKMRELDKEFDQIVKIYKEKNLLSESPESYRNGRRVLSLPTELKNQIQGVIHDESSTGKTVFMEPQQVIKLNNELFEFENDYRAEINRIFRKLSADLRTYLKPIRQYHDLIVRMDIIGAKARWARQIDGQFPLVSDKPQMNFREAYHPLLKLKNSEEEKETIPFDLVLHGKNRILLLSGPNAGGKSILMKAVILLQAMLQCGIPIPVHPESKPGYFSSFMADIGDQQSIENDLSTYSSRLKIMAEALKKADNKTIIVIDEFGSGTDPKFGGALAESMLYEFNKKGCYGVITTHYSNLKIFAFKNKGLVNGAMVFDQEKLLPTYEMSIGKPGSSFAFEIADKSGVSKQVMKYARIKTGKNQTKVEDLLVELQREKALAEQAIKSVEDKEAKLDKLISTYNNLHRELEFRRKKIKLENRESQIQETASQNRAFENLIREIREEKNLELAKKKSAELKSKKQALFEESNQIELAISKKSNIDPDSFKEGDYVKVGNGDQIGVITWIRKKRAEVSFGNLSMEVKLNQLHPAKEPIEIQRSRSVRNDLQDHNGQTHTELDLRGMSKVDALRMTEDFVDKAILSNANILTIIHGVGTGVLKQTVRKKLQEYNDIKRAYHPESNAGGEGVTIIEL